MKRLWCMWLTVAALCLCMGEGLWQVCAIAQEGRWEQPQESQIPEETQPPVTEPETPEAGLLPYALPYTELIVSALQPYDGPEGISGAAGLLVENTGNQGIRFFRLRLRQEGRYLYFEGTCLPPGGKLLVPEVSGQPLEEGAVEECLCMTLIPGEYTWNSPLVQLRREGQFRLEVENLSDQVLTVQLWYKSRDGQVLLGSTSRYLTVHDLQPGEKRIVMPYGYAADYSAVVRLTAEETVQ